MVFIHGSYLGAIITVIIFFFTICINQISVQDEISRNRKNAEIEREIEKAKKVYNFFTLGAYRLQDLDVELAEFRRLLEDLIIIRTYVEQMTIESKPTNDIEKAKKDFYDCVVTENFLLHVNVVSEMQALGDNKRKEDVSKLILEIVKHRNLYIEEMTRRYEKYIEALIKQIA